MARNRSVATVVAAHHSRHFTCHLVYALVQVCALSTNFAGLHCFPLATKQQQGSTTDVFALACTDGGCLKMALTSVTEAY